MNIFATSIIFDKKEISAKYYKLIVKQTVYIYIKEKFHY